MKLAEMKELLEELRQVLHAWLDGLHAELTTQRGVDAQGARTVTVTGSRTASAVSNVVAGFALRETTGAAPATVILRDGADSSGDELIPVTLAAGDSAQVWFGDRGPSFVGGVFVDVDGAVAGAVFLRR